MNEPAIPRLIPADPETARAATVEALAAVHARLPRLLFAAPRDAHCAATLTGISKQISTYLDEVARTTETARPANPGAHAARQQAPADTSLARIQADAEQLRAALDDFLAAPDAEPLRRLLEETVTRIVGAAPPRPPAWSEQPAPAQVPANRATGEPARVEIHRLDAAERDWWQGQLEALRRRANLALLLAGVGFAGLAALWLQESRPVPDLRPGAAPVDRLVPPPGGLGQPPATLMRGPPGSNPQSAAEHPERLAELEVEILHLRARVDALERPRVAADRPPTRLPGTPTNPPPQPPATPAPTVKATPDLPAPDARPYSDQPSYGIQVGTVKNRADIPQFIAKYALDPQRVHIEGAGPGAILILGLFDEKAQARAALAGLPPNVHRLGPFIRTFAPGKQPPIIPAATPEPGPGTARQPSAAP
jgi:hypothetical protein